MCNSSIENLNNVQKLVDKLPDDIDGAIINSEVNRRYFSSFYSSDGILLVTRKNVYLFVDSRYYEMAQQSINNIEIICSNNFCNDLHRVLNDEKCNNVAIEASRVCVKTFNDYREQLKNINLVADGRLDRIISNLRAIKSDEEINKISAAQNITDDVFSHILTFISEGMTEKDVATEIGKSILVQSGVLHFSMIVVSGSRTSLPHGAPSSKKIEHGDFITIDFGATLDGYNSDMTRTICMGCLSKKQQEVYDIVLEGQRIALENVRDGVPCRYVDALVREYFRKFGYDKEFGHGLGHGVGLEIHESPRLSFNSDDILCENMVVTIEPGIYLPSKFGVRIEDMVVVKKNGYENLAKSSKNLICI